jgi:hypothetical protein
MSDFKATPEQWAQMERSQVFNGSFQACVLELRARVEALETKSTFNDRQIRSSLVEQVHSCIVGEPECGHMQARAAIREVAAWLRQQGRPVAARMLEQEVE